MYNTGSYQSTKPKQTKAGPFVFTLGAIAVAGFVGLYVSKLIESVQPAAKQPTVQVLVATADIPLGRSLAAKDVKLIDWPAENAPFRSYTSPDEVVGRVALRPFIRGETIIDKRLAPIEAGQGLGALIPNGMRAQALRVNDESGVAGFINPGDFVDMVLILREEQGVTSRTSLQNIQIIAVGEQYQRGENQGQTKKAPIITALLRPDQAEQLAIASNNGEVVLTLRNGYDAEEIASSGFSGANVDISQEQPQPEVVASNTEPADKPEKGASTNKKQNSNKTVTKIETTTEPTIEEPKMPQVIIGGKIVTDPKNNKKKIVIVPMP